MTQSTSSPETPPIPGARRNAAAAALLAGTFAALVDTFSQNHSWAIASIALVLVHILLMWSRVRMNARIMLTTAIALSMGHLAFGGRPDDVALAASRALYLPALLAVMTLLRVAAKQSRKVRIAAHFVVDQPPSRRYLYLASGAHVFGILLNIGGYQLLLGIALAERDRTATTPEVAAIQGRRITNAVIRGFCATLLWSPVGVAINLLVPIMPTLSWIGYLPYGLVLVATFMFLGWIFDRFEPRPRRKFEPKAHEGAVSALFSLLALLLAITGAAAIAETLLGVPARGAILVVIPVMALAWVLLTEPGSPLENSARLTRDGFRSLPDSVSEICLIGSTGFLGLIIAQMIPPEAVRSLIESLSLGPGMIGCLMLTVITASSLVGVSPMISGSVTAGAVIAAGVDIPEPMLMVAALSGWACGMLLSPMTSTIAIAAIMERAPGATVGLRWNGLFVASFFLATSTAMLVWDALI